MTAMPEIPIPAVALLPYASTTHAHDAGCACPLAPMPSRPYHVFTFESGDNPECSNGCGVTWRQVRDGAE